MKNMSIANKLNLIIISMSVKQKVLDNIGQDFIEMNIYEEYIDYLMKVNLNILDSKSSKDVYKSLIDDYIKGNLRKAEFILKNL